MLHSHIKKCSKSVSSLLHWVSIYNSNSVLVVNEKIFCTGGGCRVFNANTALPSIQKRHLIGQHALQLHTVRVIIPSVTLDNCHNHPWI